MRDDTPKWPVIERFTELCVFRYRAASQMEGGDWEKEEVNLLTGDIDRGALR